MNAKPHIRRAEPSDARAIADVLRDMGWFAHITGELPQETERRVADQLALCGNEREHTVLVAEDDAGAVVGYVATHWFPNLMRGMDGYVSELFLRDAARGHGIGAALLEAVKRAGVERGATRLMLFNRRERESFQRGFYPKHGWTERDDVGFFMLDLDDEVLP